MRDIFLRATARQCKAMLDAELQKYETWEELRDAHLKMSIAIEQKLYARIRNLGVGERIICRVLGKGISEPQVMRALKLLRQIEENDKT